MTEEDNEIRLESLSHASLAQRVALMNAAYADYHVPVRVTPEQCMALDRFYDVDLTRSVVARTDWEAVGMALLALRGTAAWVSGVGVLPAWRRRGVATAMMERLIAAAREAGATTMRLEVISQNTAALALYRRLHFTPCRELLSWQRPADADPLPIPPERLTPVAADAALADCDRWRSDSPCWQRAPATLRKMLDRLKGYRLDWRGAPTACCLVSGNEDGLVLMDIAADPRTGLLLPGRILIQALAALHFGQALSIMNVPADDPLCRILAALGFLVRVRQVEMTLAL